MKILISGVTVFLAVMTFGVLVLCSPLINADTMTKDNPDF